MRVKGGGWAGGGGREDFNYPPEGLGRSTFRYSSSKVGVYKVKKSVVLQVWPKLYLCGVNQVSPKKEEKKRRGGVNGRRSPRVKEVDGFYCILPFLLNID